MKLLMLKSCGKCKGLGKIKLEEIKLDNTEKACYSTKNSKGEINE